MAKDVVLAVPETATFGTVTKLHLWGRYVSFAANSALVKCSPSSRILSGLEHHLSVPRLNRPKNIFSEEQQEVADQSKHDKAHTPGTDYHLISIAYPCEQGQPFNLTGIIKKI